MRSEIELGALVSTHALFRLEQRQPRLEARLFRLERVPMRGELHRNLLQAVAIVGLHPFEHVGWGRVAPGLERGEPSLVATPFLQ